MDLVSRPYQPERPRVMILADDLATEMLRNETRNLVSVTDSPTVGPIG